MEFAELVQKRYSVRRFEDRPVSQEDIDRILAVGNAAPTGKNNQPQRILVAQSSGAVEKLNVVSRCIFGARTVLVFLYDTDEDWKSPLDEGVSSGVQDVSIVATHIMLAAAEIGVGSCWVNHFSHAKLRELFDIPETYRPVLLMPIGYPAEDSVPSERHSAAKDISETVKYI
ncbi:MAG: nitroreductase family protein [Ruminococcus sp.]|nr:nitroreductase family protein [Ruminococcus sp.]